MKNKSYHAVLTDGVIQCSQTMHQDTIFTFTRHDLDEHIVIHVPSKPADGPFEQDMWYYTDKMKNRIHIHSKIYTEFGWMSCPTASIETNAGTQIMDPQEDFCSEINGHPYKLGMEDGVLFVGFGKRFRIELNNEGVDIYYYERESKQRINIWIAPTNIPHELNLRVRTLCNGGQIFGAPITEIDI